MASTLFDTEIKNENMFEIALEQNETKNQKLPIELLIRHWPPREPYTKFKIKTLLPEQKTINIKKNGQVIRMVTVRRKSKRFTDRWARTFLKNAGTELGRS